MAIPMVLGFCGSGVRTEPCVRVLLDVFHGGLTCVAEGFTPWQLIVSTLTGVYAVRNLDKILGLAGRSCVPMTSFSQTDC